MTEPVKRLSIDIPSDVMRSLKITAAVRGITIRKLVALALRNEVQRKLPRPARVSQSPKVVQGATPAAEARA
jgi:hypothetical protein